jgi:hypothetical protein
VRSECDDHDSQPYAPSLDPHTEYLEKLGAYARRDEHMAEAAVDCDNQWQVIDISRKNANGACGQVAPSEHG